MSGKFGASVSRTASKVEDTAIARVRFSETVCYSMPHEVCGIEVVFCVEALTCPQSNAVLHGCVPRVSDNASRANSRANVAARATRSKMMPEDSARLHARSVSASPALRNA